MIWNHAIDLNSLNHLSKNTLVEHLGIEFCEFGDDYLVAKMPVDHRTVQPFKLLHGGASVALAETIGSTASSLCIQNPSEDMVVGVEINANHVRSARSGFVFGKVMPFKIGRKLHVWNIEIKDEAERLICVSRLTIAVVPRS